MFLSKPPTPIPHALLTRGREETPLEGMLVSEDHSRPLIPDPDPFEEKKAKRKSGSPKRDISGDVIRSIRSNEAKTGLPSRDALTWIEVQMWDNGPRSDTTHPGHVQFKLRIAAMNTDPSDDKCRTRSNRVEAEVRLTSVEQFYIRARRKKKDWIAGEEDAVNQAMADALALTDEVGGDAAKTILGNLGITGVKGLGYLSYPPTQYAVVTWKPDPDTGPRPFVTILFTGGGSLKLEFRQTGHEHPKASRWYVGWFA